MAARVVRGRKAPPRVDVGGVEVGRSVLASRRRATQEMPRSHVVAIQRSRILAGVVRTVDELGYANTSVAEIVARSRVSRRTFYEMFANRDECVQAVLADTVALVRLALERAGVGQLGWRERVRLGLWTILLFLDREPALARVCVVGVLGGGSGVLAAREAVLAELAGVVDEGRFESARGGECTPVTAEGVVGAAYAIVYARLTRAEPQPLRELLGELMGIVVLPYLGSAAVRRERSRPTPKVPVLPSRELPESQAPHEDPLQGVRMRLTYRTARVLEGVHEHPGASNREVADSAGISDPGQISKLLRRLQGLGLLENDGLGHAQGEPNKWTLTPLGCQVAQRLSVITCDREEAA